MTNPFENIEGPYFCLVNDEGQYSIWPDYIGIPKGWAQVGPVGDKATCLKWIDESWTDMRPLSLSRQMEKDMKSRSH